MRASRRRAPSPSRSRPRASSAPPHRRVRAALNFRARCLYGFPTTRSRFPRITTARPRARRARAIPPTRPTPLFLPLSCSPSLPLRVSAALCLAAFVPTLSAQTTPSTTGAPRTAAKDDPIPLDRFAVAAEPVTQLISLTATNADFSLKKGQQYEAGLKGTFFRGKLDATLAIFNLLRKDLLTSTTDPLAGIRTSFEKIVLVPRDRSRSLPPLP